MSKWIPYGKEFPTEEKLVDCTIKRLSDGHVWVEDLIYCPHGAWKWTDYPVDRYVDPMEFEILAWCEKKESYNPEELSKSSSKVMSKRIINMETKSVTAKEAAHAYESGIASDCDVKEAMDIELDITQFILDELLDSFEDGSHEMLRIYQNASNNEKAILDAMLVALCGNSMRSLIENA